MQVQAKPVEKVNIVDVHNQFVSTCTKSKAHRLGLLHPVIIAEVQNQKGEWLLVKQSPDRQDPAFGNRGRIRNH